MDAPPFDGSPGLPPLREPIPFRPRRPVDEGTPTAVAAPVLPVLDLREAPSPLVVTALDAAARAAQGGDRRCRDALFGAFGVWVDRSVARCAWRAGFATGWDREDVAQEAFVVFCDLLHGWPGKGHVHAYVAVAFPGRLRDAVARWTDRRVAAGTAGLETLHDGSAEAEASLARLEAIAADLPEPGRSIVLWRVRDDAPVGEIAERLGLSRRTVSRLWVAACTSLREALIEAVPGG